MVETVKEVNNFFITYNYKELIVNELEVFLKELDKPDFMSMFFIIDREISFFIGNRDNLKKLIQEIKCDNIKLSKSESTGILYLIINGLGIISFNSIDIVRMI